MKLPNLLINLKNPIDAFSATPAQIERIRQALPETEILLATGKDRFLELLPRAEYGLVWNFKAAWYQQAPNLKALFTPAAGKDWMEPDPSGQVRTFYGSFHGRIMGESLLSMMLWFSRSLGRSAQDQQQKLWDRNSYSPNQALFGRRVLIIGCGSLGVSCVELLKAFGMQVVGVRRTVMATPPPCIDRMITFDQLAEELSQADHIVLLLPGGPETEGIITAEHFRAMKAGSYLYNLGRGNCYCEADLLTALQQGPLAGAGLDVFAEEPLPVSSPLWEQPNLLITPHSSAISREYLDLFIDEWLQQVRGFHQASQGAFTSHVGCFPPS